MTLMLVSHRIHRLARLAQADPEKRFDRLFRELTDVDFLMFAYEQIQGNKGSQTPFASQLHIASG